jgi:hypothetical protein
MLLILVSAKGMICNDIATVVSHNVILAFKHIYHES